MSAQSNIELVLPPPDSPEEAPRTEDWKELERIHNTSLPEDYKRFMERYGSGRIDEFITVFNPTASNKYLNLRHQIDLQLNVLRELGTGGSEVIPFELFPVLGGLLPFGLTDNGDVLFWIPVGAKRW